MDYFTKQIKVEKLKLRLTKKLLYFILTLIISSFFLFLALRKVDFSKVKDAFGEINYSYFILALLFTLCSVTVRSIRWRLLFRPQFNVKIYNSFSAICIGLALNNLLPFRIGDLGQAYFLGKKEQISKSFTFSVVVIERLLDLVMLLIFLIGSSFLIKKGLKFNIIIFGIVIFFLGFLTIIFFVKYGYKIEKIFIRLPLLPTGLIKKINSVIYHFIHGFRIGRDKKTVLLVILFSVLLWLIYSSIFYIFIIAFNISESFISAIFVITVIGISVMIPSSPGYIGTWEFFGITALGLLQVEPARAFSCIILYHLSQYLPFVILGLFFLIKEGFSLKDMSKVIQTND